VLEPEAVPDLLGEAAAKYRRRVAHHESAHAVASLQTGARPRIVLEILRRSDGSFGFGGVVHEGVAEPTPRQALNYAADRAYSAIAGPIGEAKYCRGHGQVFIPWDLTLVADRIALDWAAKTIVPGYAESYKHVLYRRVAGELERPAVWDAVLRIARRLEGVWPLEAARLGGEGVYVGELGSAAIALLAKEAGLPGRRR